MRAYNYIQLLLYCLLLAVVCYFVPGDHFSLELSPVQDEGIAVFGFGSIRGPLSLLLLVSWLLRRDRHALLLSLLPLPLLLTVSPWLTRCLSTKSMAWSSISNSDRSCLPGSSLRPLERFKACNWMRRIRSAEEFGTPFVSLLSSAKTREFLESSSRDMLGAKESPLDGPVKS